MANNNHKMKIIFISIAFYSLLLTSDGFNLNKLGRGSSYSRNYQQVNEAKELDHEIFLGGNLLGHRQERMRNRLFNFGKIRFDELGLLGRGVKLQVRQMSSIFR
jgi:hypothetical protein